MAPLEDATNRARSTAKVRGKGLRRHSLPDLNEGVGRPKRPANNKEQAGDLVHKKHQRRQSLPSSMLLQERPTPLLKRIPNHTLSAGLRQSQEQAAYFAKKIDEAHEVIVQLQGKLVASHGRDKPVPKPPAFDPDILFKPMRDKLAARADKLESELFAARKKVSEATHSEENAKKRLSYATSRMTYLEERNADVEAQLQELREQNENLRRASLETQQEYQALLVELERSPARLPDERKTGEYRPVADASTQSALTYSEIDAAKKHASELEENIAELKANLRVSELRAKRTELEAQKRCAKLAVEVKEAKKRGEAQTANTMQAEATLRNNLIKLQEDIERLEQRNEKNLENAEKEATKLREAFRQKSAEMTKELANRDHLKSDLSRLRESTSALTAALESSKDQNAELREIVDSHKAMEKVHNSECRRMESELQRLKDREATHLHQKKRDDDKLAESEKEIERLGKNVKDLESHLEERASTLKAFTDEFQRVEQSNSAMKQQLKEVIGAKTNLNARIARLRLHLISMEAKAEISARSLFSAIQMKNQSTKDIESQLSDQFILLSRERDLSKRLLATLETKSEELQRIRRERDDAIRESRGRVADEVLKATEARKRADEEARAVVLELKIVRKALRCKEHELQKAAKDSKSKDAAIENARKDLSRKLAELQKANDDAKARDAEMRRTKREMEAQAEEMKRANEAVKRANAEVAAIRKTNQTNGSSVRELRAALGAAEKLQCAAEKQIKALKEIARSSQAKMRQLGKQLKQTIDGSKQRSAEFEDNRNADAEKIKRLKQLYASERRKAEQLLREGTEHERQGRELQERSASLQSTVAQYMDASKAHLKAKLACVNLGTLTKEAKHSDAKKNSEFLRAKLSCAKEKLKVAMYNILAYEKSPEGYDADKQARHRKQRLAECEKEIEKEKEALDSFLETSSKNYNQLKRMLKAANEKCDKCAKAQDVAEKELRVFLK